jgi:hypothetical protein
VGFRGLAAPLAATADPMVIALSRFLAARGFIGRLWTVNKRPPKSLKSLEDLLQQAEHYSEYMMAGRSASVPATLMALTPEGLIMHVPSRFRTDEDKERFSKTIRLMAVGYKASAVAMISESWIVVPKRRGGPLDLSVPPSQSPDREEVVAVMAESRDCNAQRFLFIQRDSGGKFLGFGTSLLPQAQQVEGRYAGLMPPKEPTEEMALAARSLLQAMGVSLEKVGFDPKWN